jgi:hypothetical protein
MEEERRWWRWSGGQLKYMYLFFGGGAAKALLNFPSNRRRGRQKKSGSFIGYNYLGNPNSNFLFLIKIENLKI